MFPQFMDDENPEGTGTCHIYGHRAYGQMLRGLGARQYHLNRYGKGD